MKQKSWNQIGCILLAALCMLALAGCSLPFGGGQEEKEPEAEEEADLEYPVSLYGADLDSRPGKVVSLTPDLTEKVLDLSMGDRLVGVSEYCFVLEGTEGLENCGSPLLPDTDKIAALQPHLVITSVELPDSVLIALQQLDIEVAVLPARAGTVDELSGIYRGLSILLNGNTTGEEMGEAFGRRIQERLNGIAQAASNYIVMEHASVLYLRALPFTVATGDTLEHSLMESVGLYSIAGSQSGWIYPADEAEQETGLADFRGLDAIFMDESTVTISDLEQSGFYQSLDAVRQDRYYYIDAAAFERQGLAMLDELEYMAAYCYPEAGLATRPVEAEPEADQEPEGHTEDAGEEPEPEAGE